MNGILRKWQEICMQEMVIRQWKKRIIEKVNYILLRL